MFLGTRVVVLSAEPARMAADIEIELPRPRTLELKTDARFGEYTRRIYHLLGMNDGKIMHSSGEQARAVRADSLPPRSGGEGNPAASLAATNHEVTARR